MRKPLQEYKMIYLDAGDTLLTIPAAQTILKQYLQLRSVDRDEAHISELFTEAFRLFYYVNKQDNFVACSPDSDREFWVNLYKYVLHKLGIHEEWSEEEIYTCCHELYDIYTAPEYYELFDDVKPFLDGLKAQGFRIGIISNFAPTLKAILEDKGILHDFDPVIVSTEVGLEKPDPAIFQLALDKAGLEAKDILYIGDHETNDIWAPNQVGIDAVRIIRYSYHTGEGIHSLLELFHEQAIA
ncbi:MULTISPECIES: HAD-IA family hydrolase [unclassified Paenibacillus]|uniref:HAD-IA family hydrolase n=1 Tax=unclassified Paenibacillus TaxID=185978 RepID=UPI0027882459|nr:MULTISPECIES: HAD-IA family hydrolase [unclassified Paenibacillus]MDQ0901699.1 putative hydrolase of the HAD superfamily [Paenibacillus sp. V4I7]MDQ0919799.1 putative hydrolase of the HAD superfamily [Paenibacillus sp. V4I5]